MKKILKKEVIIAFIIGIILASSIAVYAYSCAAKDISYTKSGEETAISVETALNELYGKIPTKTLLWTNTSPESAFSEETVNLSSSLSNYTHILLQWKCTKTSDTVYEEIFKLQPNRVGQGGQGQFTVCAINNDSTASYVRRCRCVQNDNSKIYIGNAFFVNKQGSDNDKCIPIAIYGLNFAY